MNIAIVADGRLDTDPRASALGWSLRHVGNTVIAIDLAGKSAWADVRVSVAPRVPEAGGPVGSLLRRIQPRSIEARWRRQRLASALARSGADLAYPMAPDLHEFLSTMTSTPLMRQPTWDPSGPDLVTLAPHDPTLSTSPAGPGMDHHSVLDQSDGYEPESGRHRGRRLVLLYRHTPTTPGRYLHAALERAGVEVHAPGPHVEGEDAAGYDGVVVVESPYPPPSIGDPRPDIPVLFWVHHGEHHLGANLRLVDRLRPDAILLAHSWHLAHRFPVPVHRFPFGVPRELFERTSRPWKGRTYDVAMVGAGLKEGGRRYGRRAAMAQHLAAAFGNRAFFPDRVPPEELARIYADSRVVINDGGSRHHPITMRVFEAIGAGALLLTEDQPGTDLLFHRHHYEALDFERIVPQVQDLVGDEKNAHRASEARARAFSHHTYDHRVDELFRILDHTHPGAWQGRDSPASLLGRVVDEDIEIDVLASDTPALASDLPDRTVWELERILDRLRSGGRVDAAVVTRPSPDLDLVVAASRQYVYATETVAELVRDAMLRHHPDATFEIVDGILRADTGTRERYRYPPEPPT
ncbi:MAG TPA: glycosyltransferase [Acidimicrobiia bacterium]|nr:glycosyltransferase [Acidimicrobiia bacterium]